MTVRIEELIQRGLVQRVPADLRAVGRLMQDAAQHLVTAQAAIEGQDFAGAFQLAYDAARKSLTGLALARGLRTKGEGAHATLTAVIETALAGEPGVGVVGKLDRLRRTRNKAEYAGHWFDRDEVEDAIEVARAIVEWARALGPPIV